MIKKYLKSIAKSKSPLDRFLKRFSSFYLRNYGHITIDFSAYNRPSIVDLIHKIKKETTFLMSISEAYCIYMVADATKKLNGDIAEVGVYRGGSARLMAEVKGSRKIHLFDTFEGLPELNQHDTSDEFYQGQFADTSLHQVKKYLSGFDNIYLYKGYFPDTAGPIRNEKFSMVHLDVDLHESTKNCLEFFYPRMVKGGVIISHDYVNSDGVRKAFDDFYSDKPDPLLVFSETQVITIKC